MTARAAIVLADALATPVNHTFIPLGVDPKNPEVNWYEDQSQANPVGFWRISISLVRSKATTVGASAADRVARVKVALHEPQLETLSNNDAGFLPAPQVAYVSRVSAEFILPERGTLQDRKDLRKMFALLLAETQTVAMIELLQSVY